MQHLNSLSQIMILFLHHQLTNIFIVKLNKTKTSSSVSFFFLHKININNLTRNNLAVDIKVIKLSQY